MKRKGVSLVFEQVLLFMVGVVIFLISFSIFRAYELYFTETITEEQIIEVGEMVKSNLLTFSQRPDTNTTSIISIPNRVGTEYYAIRLRQPGLNITTIDSGRSYFFPMATINQTFGLAGGFSTLHASSVSENPSAEVEFQIYKRGNQIIIG